MSVFLKRGVGLDDVTVALVTSLDGQGKPTYAAAQASTARSLRKTEVIRSADGTDVETTMMFWFDGAAILPQRKSQIVLGAETFIVEDLKENKRHRSNVVDSVRVLCREE